MILGRKPENRNSVCALLAQFPRNVNCRERLVDAVGWPAKQSDLLPRHNGNGAVMQPVEIAIRRIVAAEGAVLRAQNVNHAAADAVFDTNLSSGLLNTLQIGRMGIKFGDSREIVKECSV